MAGKRDTYVHWRETARNPRFFFMDAKVSLFILLFLMHMRLWTLILVVCVMAIFTALDYYKYPLPVAWRIFKSFLAGSYKRRD